MMAQFSQTRWFPALFAMLMVSCASVAGIEQESASSYMPAVPTTAVFDNPALISWNSVSGQLRLNRSVHKTDFFQLAHRFQPQSNPLYCGIATSTMILNAMRQNLSQAPSQPDLELQLPSGKRIPFHAYSQATFLNADTDRIKPKEIIEYRHPVTVDPGLTLQQLRDIFATYDVFAQLRYADQLTAVGADLFRQDLTKWLRESRHFVVVNFHGKTLGAPTGGHISPVAAYDRESDAVLILDVAGHKNPWYWAPVELLYAAMNTRDGENHRGWLIVRDLNGQ